MLAQPGKFEGRPIVTIQFIPDDQPLESTEIHRILPLKVNDRLSLEAVRDSITRLYQTGAYTNIEVDAELVEAGGVAIRYYTQNSWFVGAVSVSETVKQPPNAAQLVTSAQLQLGERFSSENVRKGVDSLHQLLEANGYHESRIEPRFEFDERTQQVRIHFDIAPGPRAEYERPEFSGDLELPENQLVSATHYRGWFGWKSVTLDRTQQGLENVRRLYQREDRLMASVAIDSLDYNTDAKTLKQKIGADAGPVVEIRTVGADVSRGRLRQLVPVFEERTVDRDLLVEGARNLRDYFQREGYFEAQVEFKQQRVVNDRAVVDYLINRGPRHRLVDIQIEGNSYFDDETLRERMYLTPKSFQFRRGRYSESYRRRDEEAIANLYRSNGFREVEVTTRVVRNFGGNRRDLGVEFEVKEGEQWRVASLTVEGISEVDPDTVMPLITSTEGQPFSEYSVAIDRDSVLNRYFSDGFANASFQWSYEQEGDTKRVHLRYVITEGKQQFVRQVLVRGLRTTSTELVNKNLTINPGDPLSQVLIGDTQRRLYDLGIFSSVNAAIQNPDGDTRSKYVLYEIDEASRYSITGGLGAEIARIGGNRASLANPAGTAGFSPRVSLDVARLNFRGIGHTVRLSGRVSNITQRAFFNYSAPRLRNVPGLDLAFNLLYDDSGDVRTFFSRRREGSVQLSQRLSKANTALYRYTFRRVSVESLKIDPLLVPLLSQPVRIGQASIGLIQDRRDDPTDSTKGVFNTLDLGLAAGPLGSQTDFTRFLGRNSTYHRVGKKWILARSTSFGWLQPINPSEELIASNAEIPIAERFFSGGANSHRGFPENQAGPRDLTTGFPLGGQALLLNNLELRFPLIGVNLGGVLFHDAGNVFSSVSKITWRSSQRDLSDFNYLVHAVGFGIRYRTPIGPVRFDLAYAPNAPRFFGCQISNDITQCDSPLAQRISRFQFHFSIGQTF